MYLSFLFQPNIFVFVFALFCQPEYMVSVLWQEEGYTVKYSLSTRDFQRAQAIFHRISRLQSKYRHSQFLKVILPVLPFLVGQYWKYNLELGRVDSPYWSGSWGYIFPYYPVDEAIRVRIDPVENYVVAALGNTHGQYMSNTRRVKFQYYPF